MAVVKISRGVVIKISGDNAVVLESFRTHPRDTWNDLLDKALSGISKKRR